MHEFYTEVIDERKGIYKMKIVELLNSETKEKSNLVYLAKMKVTGGEVEDVEVQGFIPEDVKHDAVCLLLDSIHLAANGGFDPIEIINMNSKHPPLKLL
ncbi:hypothetical protein [Pseudalkalibacillus caeni]|uniref:Uncharacterized protein n=1 Tax=Exobacillus caeni TaxID=2574798 RepID=A0A5R9EY41_9BACL|nr:hypothetical protein [Pseudalkalibacillus caeni]TLS35409.1 hypothetical protein FCL54_20660 [Pseudalkalibacillus caeni]